jgi:hypothetical protein
MVSTLKAALKVSDDIDVGDSPILSGWAFYGVRKAEYFFNVTDVVVLFSYRCQGYMRNTWLGINEFL